MRAVLYTHDMEPITVLHLTPTMQEFMRTRAYFAVDVMDRDFFTVLPPDSCPTMMTYRVVYIDVEPLYRSHKQVGYLLFTRNEEDAMLLESAFLPGQQRELRNIRQEAYAKGFFSAIRL